jgi:hypothetical protein
MNLSLGSKTMHRNTMVSLALAALVLSAAPAVAQTSTASESPAPASAAPQRDKFSGPRFGFTVFTGDVAKLRQKINREPIMTQFGWQLETQISPVGTDSKALMEWVFLVGGVEQDELNLSLSWLAGWRTREGLELGAGPAISVNKDSSKPTTSMIISGGAAAKLGTMQVPMHVAVALAKGGPRITTLVGWIIN